MNRRSFLEFASIASCSILPTLSHAENYKDNNVETYRKKYVYQPTDYTKESQQQDYRENDILPFNNKEKDDFWSKPRRIFIQRDRTGEQSELYYYSNGQLNQKHYWLASYLLRDVQQKKMVYVDPKLLDLMCAVQAWLVYLGNHNPLTIVSGFRTLATNSSLEGAAKNSMHLYGKAVDFRVKGLDVKSIATIANQFKAGGIGLYPTSDFIHLDTGRVRHWVGSVRK